MVVCKLLVRSERRSVFMFNNALHVLRCHPLTCMLLKVRLIVDSNPIAPTILLKTHELMPFSEATLRTSLILWNE